MGPVVMRTGGFPYQSESLVGPARQFTRVVGAALASAAGRSDVAEVRRLERSATLEAFNLTCGLMSAFGRQTDDEMHALLGAFSAQLPRSMTAPSAAALRRTGVVDQQSGFAQQPSAMFELLLEADALQGSDHARSYYDAAIQLAFAVAAVDQFTSTSDLEAIELFRGRLAERLSTLEQARTVVASSQASAAATQAKLAAPAAVDDAPPRPIDELLEELDGLIGLGGVKQEVRLVTDLLRIQAIRAERGLPVSDQSRHLVFTGNPGTGKTTVARLLAQIYRTLGVVQRGHLVETDRSGLVAGYVGQTAPLVVARFDEADEGVLLIDEAYSLARGGEKDYGREAVDTIVKLIEDRRDRIVVVMAGYPEEMSTLMSSNPGLRSRFPKVIHFDDYTTDELMAIFDSIGAKGRYHLSDAARVRVRAWFDAVPRDRGFGNGRTARNLHEHVVAAQASRLVVLGDPTDEQLTTFEPADVPDPGQGPLTTDRPRTPQVTVVLDPDDEERFATT